MPTMTRVFCIILLGLLSGCATSTSMLTSTESSVMTAEETARHDWMIGKWYGIQSVKGGGKYEWLMARSARGDYKAQFRVTDAQGKVQSSQEFGSWGISGNVYFSIFLGHLDNGEVYYSDSSDPYNYDAYYILSLSENTMKYRHARDGSEFTVNRVADDFSF